MSGRRLRRLAALALLFAVAALAAPPGTTAAEEIAVLIDTVSRSGCAFERNGRRYAADAAADHLRLKYRRGKRYAATAEDFIDHLASRSSWTGKPYLILCADAPAVPAGQWLHRALEAQRAAAS